MDFNGTSKVPVALGIRDLSLMRHCKAAKKNNLVIDCKPIQEVRGDAATIKAAATEVGCGPVFSWIDSMIGPRGPGNV